jgi:hypothetical protein
MNLVTLLTSLAVTAALAAPAAAASYPISGRWGQSSSSAQGTIDCSGKRVIAFNGNQRTDSDGGVPAYRNRSVTPDGARQWRVVDEFSNGQVNDGHTTYTLHEVDGDHIVMHMQPGGTLKLQRCK